MCLPSQPPSQHPFHPALSPTLNRDLDKHFFFWPRFHSLPPSRRSVAPWVLSTPARAPVFPEHRAARRRGWEREVGWGWCDHRSWMEQKRVQLIVLNLNVGRKGEVWSGWKDFYETVYSNLLLYYYYFLPEVDIIPQVIQKLGALVLEWLVYADGFVDGKSYYYCYYCCHAFNNATIWCWVELTMLPLYSLYLLTWRLCLCMSLCAFFCLCACICG